jgi:hypothetical protein
MRGRADKLDLKRLAEAWMKELRARPESAETPAAAAVVLMNFTASAEQQWRFLLYAVEAAASDDELSHVAAGPFEHLLGWHGPEYIGAVEARALSDPRFARMVTYAWKYLMSDEVWRRVQAIKTRAE